MKCGSGGTTTSISADDNVNVNAPHQIWRMDKRVNNLGCFILYGKTNHFFPPFFFLIHLHEFMRKVFVYREKRVRVIELVAYCNYFKKIIFYCVKITQESHNFSLKLACIVCVRNIPLYVISITLLYSNEW